MGANTFHHKFIFPLSSSIQHFLHLALLSLIWPESYILKWEVEKESGWIELWSFGQRKFVEGWINRKTSLVWRIVEWLLDLDRCLLLFNCRLSVRVGRSWMSLKRPTNENDKMNDNSGKQPNLQHRHMNWMPSQTSQRCPFTNNSFHFYVFTFGWEELYLAIKFIICQSTSNWLESTLGENISFFHLI